MNHLKRTISGESADKMNKERADSKGDNVSDTDREILKELAEFKDSAEISFNKLHDLLQASMRENTDLKEQLKSAQQQNMQLTEDLQRISGEQHNAPYIDNTLERQFMDLRELVRSLTVDLCEPKILVSSIPSGLPGHVKMALAAVSGISSAQLLRSRLHARYLVQALIWRLLCDHLLAHPFCIWGKNNEIGNFVRKVQNSRKVPVNRRQLWRILTGRMLADIANTRANRIEGWKKTLVGHIEPFVKDQCKDKIEKYIEPILEGAIGLAKNLARSRTWCDIRRKGPDDDDSISQKYDNKWMEVVEKALVPYEDIDFLVTPALVQLTNSAGDAFNNPRVMVKAEVCYGLGRLSVSAPPASDFLLAQNRGIETASGRQTRGILRLGEVANDAAVNEEIGEDVEEVHDHASDRDEYRDDIAETDVGEA